MKRILLTGAAGFAGSHVLRHVLVNTDWEISCPVTLRHRGNSDRIASAIARDDSFHRRVRVVLCDLAAPIAGTTAGRLGRVDEIWNVASESHVDRSISDPVKFTLNNVALMLNLLEYARKVKPRLFLQMSTDEVYGPAAPGYAHKEGDALAPSNPYSASKAAQEAICFAYWRTFGVPVVITNTMNLIGEMQDTEKMVPRTIKAILAGQDVTVHTSPGGIPGSRFYLHARNLADAWLWLSQTREPRLYPEYPAPLRYNIVGEREVTNMELTELIGKMLGKVPRVNMVDFHTSRPGHDLRYALDGGSIARDGWHAPVSFKDSLRQTVSWFITHPEWLKD